MREHVPGENRCAMSVTAQVVDSDQVTGRGKSYVVFIIEVTVGHMLSHVSSAGRAGHRGR